MVESVLFYRCEVWTLNADTRRRMKAVEIDYLRRGAGISRLSRLQTKKSATKWKQRRRYCMELINDNYSGSDTFCVCRKIDGPKDYSNGHHQGREDVEDLGIPGTRGCERSCETGDR